MLEQLGHVVAAVIFVNQVLAVAQADQLVSRLFSSKDGPPGVNAKAAMLTWRAMLARHIWNSDGGCCGFFAVMMSFTDADLYSLVIIPPEDQEEQKEKQKQNPIELTHVV